MDVNNFMPNDIGFDGTPVRTYTVTLTISEQEWVQNDPEQFRALIHEKIRVCYDKLRNTAT